MRAKEKQKRTHGHSLTRLGLSTEVKHASELFKQSGNWVFEFSEDIEAFQVLMWNAVDQLDELAKATEKGDLKSVQQKTVRKMLARIRKVYRQIHNDDKTLSLIGIFEDLQMMRELTQELGNVLASARGP